MLFEAGGVSWSMRRREQVLFVFVVLSGAARMMQTWKSDVLPPCSIQFKDLSDFSLDMLVLLDRKRETPIFFAGSSFSVMAGAAPPNWICPA